MLRLDQLTSVEVMTRQFYYPPDALPEDRFTATINYLSPGLFTETQEKAKIKYAGGRKAKESDFSLSQFRKVLVDEILLKAVVRVEGMTLGKLQRLIQLDAERVGSSGGLETKVPVDPTGQAQEMKGLKNADDSDLTPAQIKSLGEANMKFILLKSNEFMDWVLEVCTNLAYYQDEAWQEKVKNSVPGQVTSSQ